MINLKLKKDESIQTTIKLQERLAQKESDMDSLNSDIDKLEEQISKIGGKFASNRDEIKAKLARKEVIRENIRERIQDLCSNVLPFSLISLEMNKLVKQLKIDESIQQEQSSQALLKLKFEKISNNLKKQKLWKNAGIDSTSASIMTAELTKMLKNELQYTKKLGKPVFGFSTKQMVRIFDIEKKANSTAYSDLIKNTEKIIQVDEDIVKFQNIIVSAPDDDEIGPLITDLGDLRSDQGTLQSEIDHIEEQITSNKALRQHLDTKLRDIVSKIYKTEKSKHGIKLTQNVQKVLEGFIEQITIKKIHILEQYLLECISTLMHKNDFVNVKINPETFVMYLGLSEDYQDQLSNGPISSSSGALTIIFWNFTICFINLNYFFSVFDQVRICCRICFFFYIKNSDHLFCRKSKYRFSKFFCIL